MIKESYYYYPSFPSLFPTLSFPFPFLSWTDQRVVCRCGLGRAQRTTCQVVSRSSVAEVPNPRYFRFHRWRNVSTKWPGIGDTKKRILKATQQGQHGFDTAAWAETDQSLGSTRRSLHIYDCHVLPCFAQTETPSASTSRTSPLIFHTIFTPIRRIGHVLEVTPIE